MKLTARLRSFLTIAGSTALTISYVQSATWNAGTNDSTTGFWNLNTNWSSDSLPSDGDALVFDETANQTNTNDLLTSILSLTLNGAGWNITLNTLSIGSGGIVANGTSDLGGTLTLGAPQTWTNSTGLLTVTGTVANGGNLLTIGGAGDTTINSTISGLGGLTKQDAGILTLGAANGYTGTTTVSGGELRWNFADALSTGGLTINSGGTANVQSFADTVGTVTLAQGGTISGSTGVLTTGSGGLVINDGGAISFSSTGALALGGNLAYNDTIIGSTTATIDRLYWGGVATRTFTIADGDDASGIDLDITEYLGDSGNANGKHFIKNGAGVMRLSGSAANSNLGSGSTTAINDGTLLLNKSGAVAAIAGGGTLTVGDGVGAADSAILRYSTAYDQTGGMGVNINSDGLFDLGGTSDTIGSTLNLNGGEIRTTGTGTLSIAGGCLVTTGGKVTADSGSTGGVSSGAGNNVLLIYNTNSGAETTAVIDRISRGGTAVKSLVVNDGVQDVDVEIFQVYTSTGGLSKSGTGTVRFSGSVATRTGGQAFSMSAGVVELNKSASVAALHSNVTVGDSAGATGSAILRHVTGSANGQIGNVAVAINSDGRWELNGKTESIGLLTLNAGGQIDIAGGTLSSNGLTITNNTLDSGAATYTTTSTVTSVADANTSFITGNLSLGAGTRSFVVGDGAAATDLDVQAVISNGGITKNGAGLMLLSGNSSNTFTTTTTVTVGELQLGKTGATAIGGNLTVNGGLAKLTGSGGNQIANTGGVSVSSGTFDLNGLNETVNSVTLTGGTITGGVGVLTSNFAYDMQAGSVSAILGGSVGLNKTTAGTVILSGANTYNGGTTITDGILKFANPTAMPASGTVAVGATGTLAVNAGAASGEFTNNTSGSGSIGGLIAGLGGQGAAVTFASGAKLGIDTTNAVGGTMTYAGVINNPGGNFGITKLGEGNLVLNQTNTYSGLTTVSGGTLALSGSGTLGSGAGGLTMSGGSLDLGGLSGSVAAVSVNNAVASGDTISNGSLTGTSYAASNATGNAIISANLLVNAGAGFTKTGTGTTTLSGTNTYTGATTLTDGTLSVSATSNLGAAASNLVFNGGTLKITGTALSSVSTIGHTVSFTATKLVGLNIEDVAHTFTVNQVLNQTTGGLTKTGLGTVVLNQTNTYNGATSVNGGTLEIQNAGTGITQTHGALAFAGADGTLLSNNAGSGTLSTTYTTFTARTAGNTGNIVSTGGTPGTTNIVNSTGAAGFIDKGIYFNGADFAARNATNTYFRALSYGVDPSTAVSGTVTAANHVKITTDRSGAGLSLLSLNLSGTGVDWNNSTGNLTVPGIIKSGGGTESVISGGLLNTASNAELVIRADTANDSLNVSSQVSGFSGGLTKSGAGTLTLSHATNGYTGATNVNGGTLLVSGAIGNSAVTVKGGAVLATDAAASFGSTVTINDGAILAAGGAAAAGTATVTGATAFNNNSIFSWDIDATGLIYDKLIAPSLASENAAGDAIFRIVVADHTFGNAFWNSTQTWTDIFTTDGSTAIANWANLFTVSVVKSDFTPLSPAGSFSISGNTLTYTAIPEPTSALAGLLLGAGLLRRRRK